MSTAAVEAAPDKPNRQGYEARYLGKSVLQNPYPAGSSDGTDWSRGWFECDRELKGQE